MGADRPISAKDASVHAEDRDQEAKVVEKPVVGREGANVAGSELESTEIAVSKPRSSLDTVVSTNHTSIVPRLTSQAQRDHRR
jgi:hypothetical protein